MIDWTPRIEQFVWIDCSITFMGVLCFNLVEVASLR